MAAKQILIYGLTAYSLSALFPIAPPALSYPSDNCVPACLRVQERTSPSLSLHNRLPLDCSTFKNKFFSFLIIESSIVKF